ncbi:DNA-binding transcriptional MocR family regulator [Dysgonomonas alginatilytica]|uniref:DNA-binding transcriptional MocR family regulator n=1 Tax=Dysgonomonas alginatilytica TaxID=1605892 RepID=A0A2V3PVD0_9BACT|nr:PLP-dependent aminotransferase family protein [Dysgonomonas alginatilytica]PXV68856.1 DNA-binding transcriptional MocR family regulator [Dysgonomonas alginatilytica]
MKREILYQKIAGTIARQIKAGIWRVGDKLPSLRTISRENGISLNTAIQAYYELEKEGFIVASPKSGYFVNYKPLRLSAPATTQPPTKDTGEEEDYLISEVYRSIEDLSITRFSMGVPEDILLPIAKLNKELIRAMRSLPGSGTRYEDAQGSLKLRNDIARFTYNWNGNLTEEDIVITAGAGNATSLALLAITQRGDTIAVESPVYFGILQLANSLGLRVLELPTNPIVGIDPDALKKVLPQIKACILISNFSNPMGCCMPEENKKAVVKMLADYNIPLIEDDLYGDVFFENSRPKPCKAFDEEGLVLWCSSVSKTLAPGYRVGWIAPGKFKNAIIRQKKIHLISTPPLTQMAVANFMENSRYENHLHRLRRELHSNSLHFVQSIIDYFPEETKIVRPQGGFMIWVELDKKIDTTKLYYEAMRQRISIAPGRMFTLQDQFKNCMRLSYGQKWTPAIQERLMLLGDIIKKSI